MKISDDARLLDFFFNPRCLDDNDEYKDQKPFLVFNLLVGYVFGFEVGFFKNNKKLISILPSITFSFKKYCPDIAFESNSISFFIAFADSFLGYQLSGS
jgi:hypothetical protein